MGYFDDLFASNDDEEKKKKQASSTASTNQASSSGYFSNLFATPTQQPQQQPAPQPVKKQQQPTFLDTIKSAAGNAVHSVESFLSSNNKPKPPSLDFSSGQDSQSAQLKVTPQLLQQQQQTTQVAGKVSTDISNTFQGTLSQVQQITQDPFALHNVDAILKNPKKVVTDVLNIIPESFNQGGSIGYQTGEDIKAKAPASQTVGDILKGVAAGANFAFAPLTTLFTAADKTPLLGTVSKLITAPWIALGEGAAGTAHEIIDALPISQQAKNNLKPGVGDIFSLAAQLAAGHALGGETMDTLTKKHGVTDAQTVLNTAVDLAKEKVDQAPNAEVKTPYDTPDIIQARQEQAAIPATSDINTPERQQMREDIAQKLYDNGGYADPAKRPQVPIKSEKRADIVTGLPASGKNTVISTPLVKAHGAILIDADESKLGIPESNNGTYNGAVHKESVDINNKVLDKALDAGNNIVMPIVGKTIDRVRQIRDALVAEGYEVHLHHNEVSVDTSVQRAIQRYKNTGKFVDPDYIVNEVGLKPNQNYDILKTEKGFSTYEKFNNDVPRGQPATLIERGTNEPGTGPTQGPGGSYGSVNSRTPETASTQQTGNKATAEQVSFQSPKVRAKQADYTKELSKIASSSDTAEDQIQKINDLVGKTLDESQDDKTSLMGLRTALNKEMQGIVGENGTYKKNYAMLKLMQSAGGDTGQYLSSLEDHIALLDNVIQSRAQDDFARTFGAVPRDLPEESPIPRGSVVLGSGPNPNLDKFVQQDVVPYAKDTVNGMKKAFTEIRTWLSPTATVPKEALDSIMKNKGEMEQSQFRAEQATKNLKSMWNKQNENSRLSFMQAVETGAAVPEKFQQIADFYRQRLDAAYNTITKYKDINFLDNFFPHFWEKPEDVQKFLAQQASRRPFEGSKSFLKNRVFETIKDGIEAGYTPVTTNPEELMQIYEQNVRKFDMAQKIKNDLIDKGFWKFVPAGEKVPDGFAKIDDRIAKVYFPPATTEVSINGSPIKKMIEAGEYHAQADVARIINNYLSADKIMDTAVGKGLMNVKNTMNAFEMGFSAFHGTMETLDSVITKFSLGLSRASQGNITGGIKDIVTAPLAPLKYFQDGQKFFNNDPELLKIEQDLFTGGASFKDKQYYKNTVFDTFVKRAEEGNYMGVAVRAPMATIELSMRLLLSYYVPRLKVGAFRDLFSAELERNSQAIADGDMTREEVARKAWGNIENRMGEVNYDNFFWDRTLKTSMMLMFRSVGWNLGTVREIGGSFVDAAQQLKGITRGEMPALTPKMSYTLSLLFTTAAIGSLYQYLHTGKGPQSALDMFYPQNGAQDPNGNPMRIQFPTYLKDMYAATHNPVKMVGDKFAPDLSSIIELLNNKDYYNNFVVNTHDNLPTEAKQVALYLLKTLNPFSVQSLQQMRKGNASLEQQAENFLGVQKAPIDTITSPKEQRLQQAAQDQLGTPGPQTPEQQQIAQWKSQARKDIVNKVPLKQSDAFMNLVKSGTIKTRTQAENFIKDAGLTPDQRLFKHLSTDRKKQVLQK